MPLGRSALLTVFSDMTVHQLDNCVDFVRGFLQALVNSLDVNGEFVHKISEFVQLLIRLARPLVYLAHCLGEPVHRLDDPADGSNQFSRGFSYQYLRSGECTDFVCELIELLLRVELSLSKALLLFLNALLLFLKVELYAHGLLQGLVDPAMTVEVLLIVSVLHLARCYQNTRRSANWIDPGPPI